MPAFLAAIYPQYELMTSGGTKTWACASGAARMLNADPENTRLTGFARDSDGETREMHAIERTEIEALITNYA